MTAILREELLKLTWGGWGVVGDSGCLRLNKDTWGVLYIYNNRNIWSEHDQVKSSTKNCKMQKSTKSEPLTVKPVQNIQACGFSPTIHHCIAADRALNAEIRAINATTIAKIAEFQQE
jgi:hypothetical protein